MKKEKYDDLCKSWEDFYKKLEASRGEIKSVDDPDSFGPFTVFYKEDLGDLKSKDFILPGMDKCFLDLNLWGENELFIKDIEEECYLVSDHAIGKVVGFGYDFGDYYYLVQDLERKRVVGEQVNIKHSIVGKHREVNLLELMNENLNNFQVVGKTSDIKRAMRNLKNKTPRIAFQSVSWDCSRKFETFCTKELGLRKDDYSGDGNYIYLF